MNTAPARAALADYLDRTAESKANCTSVFDLDAPAGTGADTLHNLADYVRSLPQDHPALVALAEEHRDLDTPPVRRFVPHAPAARALVDAVGTDRVGTSTEFVLRFVSAETGRVLSLP